MTFTELEKKVYNATLFVCYNDYCADVDLLSAMLKESKPTIKGALGSLTKKGKVLCEYDDSRKCHDVFAIHDHEPDWLGYGCDKCEFEDWISSKL